MKTGTKKTQWFLRPDVLYLLCVLGVCFGLGFAAWLRQGEARILIYEGLQKGFTAFPVLAALVTRKITQDQSPWPLSLKLWKRPGLWLFCAVIPGILIVIGAVVYFALFPQTYSGIFRYGLLLGIEGEAPIRSLSAFWLVTVALAAVCFPLQLLELGEELGWRGYLPPKQIQRYGIRKAVLLNSFLWGAAHLPLIYFGFNYSLNNPLAPFSNMVMMMLVCMTLGILCCYVTLISGNCLYAAVIHGVVNLIGEVPVFLSVSLENTLLGPNPTGLIGMFGLMLCALVMLRLLKQAENRLPLNKSRK